MRGLLGSLKFLGTPGVAIAVDVPRRPWRTRSAAALSLAGSVCLGPSGLCSCKPRPVEPASEALSRFAAHPTWNAPRMSDADVESLLKGNQGRYFKGTRVGNWVVYFNDSAVRVLCFISTPPRPVRALFPTPRAPQEASAQCQFYYNRGFAEGREAHGMASIRISNKGKVLESHNRPPQAMPQESGESDHTTSEPPTHGGEGADPREGVAACSPGEERRCQEHLQGSSPMTSCSMSGVQTCSASGVWNRCEGQCTANYLEPSWCCRRVWRPTLGGPTGSGEWVNSSESCSKPCDRTLRVDRDGHFRQDIPRCMPREVCY